MVHPGSRNDTCTNRDKEKECNERDNRLTDRSLRCNHTHSNIQVIK